MSMDNGVAKELQRLATANGGILLPEKVVEAARPKSSPLHSRFEWDDSKAAHEHRLWQARMLIRVTVTLLPGTEKRTERVWVSLREDRKDGGYRPLTSVLTDGQLREQLLADALADMEYYEEKYKHLNELADVFKAARKVRLTNPQISRARA